MAVDFVGFGKMVDALGGVEVCTPSPLYDLVLGSVLEDTGRQRVNGGTALNYVRARHVTTEDNGDYGRIKRQQLFLSSLLRSLISTNTFFSPTKLNNVVNMFIGDSSVDNVTTKDLVNLGQSLQKVAAGHITFVTVPTSETDENGDEVPGWMTCGHCSTPSSTTTPTRRERPQRHLGPHHGGGQPHHPVHLPARLTGHPGNQAAQRAGARGHDLARRCHGAGV